MDLLERDEIELDDVCDYHIYPIADNDTPKLSADRLEYSLTNPVFIYPWYDLDYVKRIYDDIEVLENEEGEKELGFKTKKIAREFVKVTSELSVAYRDHKTRFFMQAIADITKKANDDGIITIEDLYNIKEKEVIDRIKNSKYGEIFNKLLEIDRVNISKEEPKGIYYVNHGAKVRYIDPLFINERMSKACKIAQKMIDKNLSYDMDYYIYYDETFNELVN